MEENIVFEQELPDDSNVITMTPLIKGDTAALLPFKKVEGWCNHKVVEVDESERELRCKKCNAFIDPYEYVLSWARKERQLIEHMDEIKERMRQLAEEKTRLEMDVANLKASKKRHSQS